MKTIVMSFFVLLSSFLTGFTYEKWDTLPLEEKYPDTIILNQKTTIVEQTTTSTNKRLVPNGVLLTQDDVYIIYYSYIVNLDENYDLEVLLDKAYFIKGEDKYLDAYNLLNFEFNVERTSPTIAKVTVSISLNEPKNKTEYDIVNNSHISFSLIFKQKIMFEN